MERTHTHTGFAHIDIHHRFHLISNQLTSVHGTSRSWTHVTLVACRKKQKQDAAARHCLTKKYFRAQPEMHLGNKTLPRDEHEYIQPQAVKTP